MSNLQVRNETVINAPISKIWNIITDINMLPKVNPGVVSATGRMDKLGETRTCEIDNKGRKGTMTEKLIELIPEQKTVWTIESDTMGMGKMLSGTKFCFSLEKIDNYKTKVVNETYYDPANLFAKIMNGIMMKKMISKAQTTILNNIRSLTEQ
jgi:carbon monoxide dehydrogenase subunit G